MHGVQLLTEAALHRIKNASLSELTLTQVPLFSSDMRGMQGVSKVSDMLVQSKQWKDTMHGKKQRVVLLGGKGGVGKTTSSAALALACARMVL